MDNLVLQNIIDDLLPNEKEVLLKVIEDALKRGYSLGFPDGISMTQGRPQSSNSDHAIKHYLDTFKETYNI